MKKILLIILALSVLFSGKSYAFDNNTIEKDVVIIIEIYNNDKTAYEEIYKDIKLISPAVSDIRYIYTDVFYGFSVLINSRYIEAVKEVQNVKNVYISPEFELPEVESTDEYFENTSDINLFSSEDSYNGKGTLVAVLDSEFRVDHECFTVPEDYKITKDTMADIYNKYELNSELNGATCESTWYNEKIPYRYDYGENDTNTTARNSSYYHGTRVASLVGGNSSNIRSYATQAQLALFKITTASGIISYDTIISALDDAYKLKVDAVNMSFGDDNGFVNYWSDKADIFNFSLISNKFKEAGIPLFVSTGNSGNAGNISMSGRYYSLAENTDFGTVSSYASQPNVVSAGALTYYADKNPEYASYSSVGATNDLRIAPDLTYYGNVNTAYPSGTAAYRSGKGTSFSSPLLCGIYLSCKEYFKSKYPDLSSKELNILIEQAMMSTANIVTYNDIPVSPRLQGAGYPELNNAVSTPVVLTGSDNKSKINLFDTIENTLKIKFKARNLSDNILSYYPSLKLTTDNYQIVNNNKINTTTPVLISDAEVNFDAGTTLTLQPKEEKEITVTVKVSEEFINGNFEIFKNGFFLEGYIYLIPEDSSLPSLNIPYMAYRGNWSAVPVFDTANAYNTFGFYYNNNSNLNLKKSGVTYVNPNTAYLKLGVLRNIENLNISLYKDGDIKDAGNYHNIFRKNYYKNNILQYLQTNATTVIPSNAVEGEYILKYTALTEYGTSEHIYNENIVVDKTNPEIISVKRVAEKDKVYLEIYVKDNIKLNTLHIDKYSDDVYAENVYSGYIDDIYSTGYKYEYDITDAQLYNYKIRVTDMALNSASYMKSEESYTSYIAGYDDNEISRKVIFKSGILTLESALSEAENLANENITKIKYFVWDGLAPLIQPITLK